MNETTVETKVRQRSSHLWDFPTHRETCETLEKQAISVVVSQSLYQGLRR